MMNMGMHRIQAFLISGILPNIGYDLPDIRPDTGY
jgi:hypothetical protein